MVLWNCCSCACLLGVGCQKQNGEVSFPHNMQRILSRLPTNPRSVPGDTPAVYTSHHHPPPARAHQTVPHACPAAQQQQLVRQLGEEQPARNQTDRNTRACSCDHSPHSVAIWARGRLTKGLHTMASGRPIPPTTLAGCYLTSHVTPGVQSCLPAMTTAADKVHKASSPCRHSAPIPPRPTLQSLTQSPCPLTSSQLLSGPTLSLTSSCVSAPSALASRCAATWRRASQ